MSDPDFQLDPRLIPHLATAEAIARLLHPHAEVVIHDTTRNCIAALFNPISGRRVGDPSGIDDIQGLVAGSTVQGPYLQKNLRGRDTKYVSTVLRDVDGEAVGLMCTNLDVSPLLGLIDTARRFLDEAEGSESFDALFENDWQARIDVFVRRHLEERLLHPRGLNRDQRLELVAALRQAGAFQAKAAAAYVANVLGISRSTVYNDLNRLEAVDRPEA